MYMTLYHHTTEENIRPILKSGALNPTSYGDIDEAETRFRRLREGTCPPYLGWTPSVLYLTTADRETRMIAYTYRDRPWPLGRVWRFTVRVPIFTVQPWHEFAEQHGANAEWLGWSSQFRGDEYVTTVPVPDTQWLEVRNMSTGRTFSQCLECAQTAHKHHQH